MCKPGNRNNCRFMICNLNFFRFLPVLPAEKNVKDFIEKLEFSN